jgi:hypothetical protein
MDEPGGCSTRNLALLGLLAYGAIPLMIGHYDIGPSLGGGGDFYLPLLGPATLLYVFTMFAALWDGVVSGLTSFRAHRWRWLGGFLLLNVLCVLGLVVFITLWLPPPGLSTLPGSLMVFVLASGPLLTLVATLLYLWLARPSIDPE